MESRRRLALVDQGRCGHVRLRRSDQVRRRLSASFTIPAMVVSGMAMLILACGDGAVEPTPPPPPVPTTVTVTPGSATFGALGEMVQFAAEVRDQSGQVMTGTAVAWTSSAAAIAAVDASGQVTAAANGRAMITAMAGSVSGTAAVTVAQVVSTVAVSPAADTLVAFGDTVRLVAEAVDANGHGMAGEVFSWSSSDTLVARVNDSGLVESLAEGKAAVTATATEVTGRAELAVVRPLPTTVAVSPDTVRFTALRETTQLVVEVRDQAERVMATALVSWSSEDTLVAVVDSAGLITAVGGGTTTVTAVAGGLTDTVVVTVAQSVGSVAVSPAEGTISLGDTLRLTAEAFDKNGHEVSGASFFWSSSDTGIALVDDTGLVEGIAEGTARIAATAGEASGVAEVTVDNPDRAALVALYHATDGPNWRKRDNWLTDAPLGEWRGVSTADGRVVQLRLHWQGLAGPIPPELGDLTRLKELWLHGNDLHGPIPPELGNLVGLKVLWLYANNALTGPIPVELTDLAELEDLRLSGNDLNGPIPPELGHLASLKYLRLDNTGLTGPIPPELGNLTSLKELWLYNNSLSGSIPPELGNLGHLEILVLQTNPLTGAIPPELANLANLKTLKLDYFTDVDGGLTGAIPQELGNLVNLEELSLGGNYLSGPIPPELAKLSVLEHLILWGNALTGPIPPELGSLSSLKSLFLSTNELTGSIPPELGNLANLTSLALADNALTGPIPPELANLTNLTALGLGGNPGLCAPADPMLQAWLAGRFTAFPCPADPTVRLLPRALMREDSNGLSLVLPYDLRSPSAVTISDPSVVGASVADGWLELTPLGRGSADIEVVATGGGSPAVAGVVVRAGVGTFGIDIVMDQPAPLGYEEAMTVAADWWSSALDGTELPDRSQCRYGGYKAVADDLLIWATSAYVERYALAFATVCLRGGADSETVSDPGGGKVTVNTAFNSADAVDVMRHEIGHLLGLVLWPTSTGLLVSAGGESYFTGSGAVAEYRASGGDPSLPGVPIEPGFHWHKQQVRCELMSGSGPCDLDKLAIDAMDAISLAALADAGYTVDMSKATPWRRPENAQGDAVGGVEHVIDHVVIEWVKPAGRPRH